MTVSATTVMVVSLVLLVVIAAASWAYQTANRLDRLHVRVDLTWQALDAALARRAVVARSLASSLGAAGRGLLTSADRAELADRPDREAAENELTIEIAQIDTTGLRAGLIAELADAEARVAIARRFHNDAVRDTLALRRRRSVRWLHLGGTAPMPRYFEIRERAIN